MLTRKVAEQLGSRSLEGQVVVMKEFVFTGSLASGDTLVIDTKRMSALLNGQDVRHLVQGVPDGCARR